ncbi:MAG TPA: hypothetical protein V6C85_22585 [Allocoleopsis sp.]
MQLKHGYYRWMVYSLCLILCAGCTSTSNISECPAFSGFVGKTFTLDKAQYLWQDKTSESVYEITNIGEKPYYKERMKILTTLPVGTSLRLEKVQRTVGMLGFPWDYAMVQVVVPGTFPKTLTAQKLLNYDYQNPWGGHYTVIHNKEGTGFPCLE